MAQTAPQRHDALLANLNPATYYDDYTSTTTLMPTTLTTHRTTPTHATAAWSSSTPSAHSALPLQPAAPPRWRTQQPTSAFRAQGLNSTGKGILIGMLSAFGSAALVGLVVALVYFFRHTSRGRILLDRIGRPGEFDDEQQFLREEEEALAEMDELQKAEYYRAKAFVTVNPPESVQTDISLSQFLAIQEKGVSAWEFEPELEIANCFVEARTEIEFFDSECSVQSNLPIPKQNEVYYWEAKLYDLPDPTIVHIGLTTKPYPLFRLPGFHRHSLAYTSAGLRRFNQPFAPTPYGPPFVQGDVVGVGYRPRTGTVFFTRNGKKLEDVAHGLKSQNFFPTVGARGPCRVHVNFGQMGFLFIEANVKKWGLAPMTGSLAPPPPYGSEAGSILLEGGREGVREGMAYASLPSHARTNSAQVRLQGRMTRSPGPERSPTDISLAQFNFMDATEEEREEDASADGDAEGGDDAAGDSQGPSRRRSRRQQEYQHRHQQQGQLIDPGLPCEPHDHPPPDYESPEEDRDGASAAGYNHNNDDYHDNDEDDDDDGGEDIDSDSPPRPSTHQQQQQQQQRRRRKRDDSEERPLLIAGHGGSAGGSSHGNRTAAPTSPPLPSYEAATSEDVETARGRQMRGQASG